VSALNVEGRHDAPAVSHRLRVVFRQGDEVRYISHLDLVRAWERAIRRAELPVAYTRGFNPRLRLLFASALAVGFTGRAEMLDLLLEKPMDLADVISRLETQLPAGLSMVSVARIDVGKRPLPSLVRAADYEVTLQPGRDPTDVQERIDELLSLNEVVRRRRRPDGVREYDLRPLVQGLRMRVGDGPTLLVFMRLQASPQGTGRPDEVMDALGLSEQVLAIDRTRIWLAGEQLATAGP